MLPLSIVITGHSASLGASLGKRMRFCADLAGFPANDFSAWVLAASPLTTLCQIASSDAGIIVLSLPECGGVED